MVNRFMTKSRQKAGCRRKFTAIIRLVSTLQGHVDMRQTILGLANNSQGLSNGRGMGVDNIMYRPLHQGGVGHEFKDISRKRATAIRSLVRKRYDKIVFDRAGTKILAICR